MPVSLPDLAQAAHRGSPLMPVQDGAGDGQIDLAAVTPGSDVEIRLACSGPGSVKLTDQDGGTLLATTGCDGHAIYGADFTSAANNALVQISAADDVSWEVEVFWIMS